MHNHGKGILGKLLMILCVAVPVAVMVLMLLSRSSIISIGGWVPYAFFLLCPLSHFLMIPFMSRMMTPNQNNNSSSEIDNKPACH